jgi:hypothetical protein
MSGVTGGLERDRGVSQGSIYVPKPSVFRRFGGWNGEHILLGGPEMKARGVEQQDCIPAAMTDCSLSFGLQIFITFVEHVNHGLVGKA